MELEGRLIAGCADSADGRRASTRSWQAEAGVRLEGVLLGGERAGGHFVRRTALRHGVIRRRRRRIA